MNLVPRRTVFFEKTHPAKLAFRKNMEGYGKRRVPAAKLKNRPKPPQMQQPTHRKKLQKRGAPLVEQRKICYTILHDAPSPSGKAGDFDSPIVGSTPAGAT